MCCFQGSVRTVASELVDDMSLLQLGKLSIETFMKNYGHLRPNSYDILSPRYDEMSELFSIGSRAKIKTQKTKRSFKLSADKTTAINSLLKKEGCSNLMLRIYSSIVTMQSLVENEANSLSQEF